ncbi:VTT domain-containing protein [Methylocapsa palsarum]|uniref:Uncharacterized membrane protein YdjX, TVP38/TMEM64 family, SNARE-associated domain n=1 Tax=Methylocapsa palsarum TaxID=1612308 RepID=A0A1I3Y0C9_9HYPH|nr:VTT domain-containing protein [Methylocapsa palsarum]SFK25212.1 Uncharacterized membrane protein YdjX, TVP38/TMEM64 family, SNARE-associated domain [Methylocapsa palsarum]
MSSKNLPLAQLAYVVAVLVGILIYYMYNAEIRAHLFASGGSEGLTAWIPIPLLAIALFFLSAVCIFLSIPAAPLFYLAFGFFFGAYEGMFLAGLATTAGSVAAFCFFRRAIPQNAALRSVEIKNVFMTLLLLRSSPWLPNPLITLFCSAVDVGIGMVALTTFLGTLPLIAIYTIAAGRLYGHLDASILYSTDVVAAFFLLGVISLVGFLQPVKIALQSLKAIQAGIAEEKPTPPVESAPAGHSL